jgi:hypothetical protein
MDKQIFDRHLLVIGRRMERLHWCITKRNWEETEFAYDQVLRALQKLEDAIDEIPPHLR